MTHQKEIFKIGDEVKVSPGLTALTEWLTGTIIKIFKNPFLGGQIAIKDSQGRIFFGTKDYFKLISE